MFRRLHRPESRPIARRAWRPAACRLLGLPGVLLAASGGARADSVVQYLEAGRLAPATIAVLDPVHGSSQGTLGQPVKLAVGDVVLLRYAIASIPSSATRGIQSYATAYLPPGTELVGARFVDGDGRTLEPRRAGLALDGCGGGSLCNSPPAGMQSGSIAQLYADTGVFFSTSPRSGAPLPMGQWLTLDDGVALVPDPLRINPEIVSLLGDLAGPWFAHNAWDAQQAQGFGTGTTSYGDGDGNTPFGYGSPVAGPDTYYRFEVDVDGTLDGNDGPWQRIRHPGSQIGSGLGNIGSSSNLTRVGLDTQAGHDLSPATPLQALAVRFAAGQAHAGEVRHVELAVRVTALPLDPAMAVDALCAEAFGGDIAARNTNNGGQHHPWSFFVPHPACFALRLQFDLDVDANLALAGQDLHYTLSGRNLALQTETGAQATVAFDPVVQGFVAATPPPAAITGCAPPWTALTCLSWNLGDLAPSQAFAIALTLQPQGGGATAAVVHARYRSTPLAATLPDGYVTRAMVVLSPTPRPTAVLGNATDVTAAFAPSPSNTWQLAGSIGNDGTAAWDSTSFTVTLPASNWGLFNNQISIGGNPSSCTTVGLERTCSRADHYAPATDRAIGFRLVVPAGVATGLYPVGLRIHASGPAGAFESEFRRLVLVPVGAVRTPAPQVDCPIRPLQDAITGSSVGSAAIALSFNGAARASAVADGGGAWASSDFASFGGLHGGIEVTATAQAGAALPSAPSLPCLVFPLNRPPTLDPIADRPALLVDAGTQTVELGGIGPGIGDPPQALQVTATSDNPALIPHPGVAYASPAASASLSFAPVAGQAGVATITVTVIDDGGTLGGGVDRIVRSFSQAVLAPGIFADGFETPVAP
jgi:hypothetical protein